MDIINFVETAKKTVIEQLTRIAGASACTRKNIPFTVGEADIFEARGGSIEKATLSHLSMRSITPPGAERPVDYMVFQLEIFPVNPHCPMGHFNTEWALTGSGPYHMNIDLFPALNPSPYCDEIRSTMDALAARHGRNPDAIRAGLNEHYCMDHWPRPLSSCTGFKLMNLGNGDLDLFTDTYTMFFELYTDLLVSTESAAYDETENTCRLVRNGRWLEYITLKDVAVKMGLSAGLPPEVIIQLSFPPSAYF